MDTELPIEPVDDSPVFRASLASLDAKAYTVRKTCKNALHAAHTVYELLEKLEAAEAELFDALDTLKQQIFKVDAKGRDGYHTRAETGVVKDLRAWKMNERMEERQQLETLVTSRIKAIQTDLKVKGLGGGGALNTFEDQAKMHYQALGKHLLPSTNPKYESDRSQARQSAADTDYALSRYTIHSQLLWSAPPYSPPCLDLAICLNMWLSGVLPSSTSINGLAKNLTAEPNIVLRSPDQVTDNMRAEVDTVPGAPFQGTRRRLRTLSQKASMPTLLTTSPSTANLVIQPLKSVATIKEQLREELELMSHQKQALERAWRERESRRTELSSISAEAHQQATLIETEQPNSKRQSFQSSRLDSSAKLQAIAEADSPAQSKRMKKTLGMGKRLKGMIHSASFSANLSLKAFNEPPPSAESACAAPRKSMQFDSSSSTSSQMQMMTRPQPEKRHSFTANSSSRPSSYCSPFLPSPILPSVENGFTSNSEVFPTTIQQVLQVQPGSGATDASKQVYRDLQSRSGMQVLEDELHRESAGRKREGMLWTSGIWEDVATSSNKGGDRKERAKWDHCWVVLAGCKLYEYRDALSCKPELDHETIDLQFANARQGRDTDRRFTFEIVTPQYGKRMYQTTSYEDMKSWIYAICNAIESNINGTGTLRVTIPNGKQINNSADDYGQPLHLQSSGIGLGLPSTAKDPFKNSSNGVPIDPSWTKAIERRTSFKDALRQGRANLGLHSAKSPDDRIRLAGHKRGSSKGTKEIHHAYAQSPDVLKGGAMQRSRSSLSISGVGIGFLNPGSRQSSRSSKSSKRSSLISISDESAPAPRIDPSPRQVDPVPFPVLQRSGSFYQLELDDDMRNAVLLADPIVASTETTEQQAFTTNKGMIRELAPSETMTQERFDDALSSIPTPSSPADMVLLRKIANQPGNQTCSDCGHPIKGETSQRWATISIHNNPQVLFLCIRCAGVHRSFGTHISKVRSPDLDKWSDEAILTARAWGNARGNQIWERNKPPGEKPRDDSLPALREYIENKYVKGIWLSDEDRQFYLNEQAGIAL